MAVRLLVTQTGAAMADKTKASTARGKQVRRDSGEAGQEGGKHKNRAKDSKDSARRR
jgi:hypothetical protein